MIPDWSPGAVIGFVLVNFLAVFIAVLFLQRGGRRG